MTNSNMSFKILFSSFYSPHYLKDNFSQTFEYIPRKRCKSLFIPQLLFSTFLSAQGEACFNMAATAIMLDQ